MRAREGDVTNAEMQTNEIRSMLAGNERSPDTGTAVTNLSMSADACILNYSLLQNNKSSSCCCWKSIVSISE